MHGKRLIITILLIVIGATSDSRAQQQRLVVTRSLPVLNFDPLTGHYQSGAMPQLATFVDQWRSELGANNLHVVEFSTKQSLGYEIYNRMCDSTLRLRAQAWIGMVPCTSELIAKFGVTPQAIDSLAPGELLVADLYTVADQSTIRYKRVNVKSLKASRPYIDSMAMDDVRLRQFFVTPLARLDTTITTRDCYFGPSSFSALFHSFQREVSGADISIFAPPLHDVTIDSGDILIKDITDIFRFDNALVVVSITGSRLIECLEKVYGMRYFTVRTPDSDMVRTRVPHYLHDDAAGIRYRVDLAARSGHRVSIYSLDDGTRFDPRKEYTVAMNSFRAKDFAPEGTPIDTIRPDYRIALLEWMNKKDTIGPRRDDNWSPGPEKVTREIEKRERTTIFEAR